MTAPCPGPCNNTWRRAEKAHREATIRYDTAHAAWTQAADPELPEPDRPQPHTTTPNPGEPTWCNRCTSLIRRALTNLDDLAAILQASIDGHRPTTTNDRVTGSNTPRSPEPRTDLLDELLNDLTWWEDNYRAARAWPTRPQRGRTHITLTGCTAWLNVHLDGILNHPTAGPDFGRLILRWHRQLENATHSRPDTIRKPGRCPRCHTARLALVDADRPADRRVECENCGRILTLDEYDQLADQQTGESA